YFADRNSVNGLFVYNQDNLKKRTPEKVVNMEQMKVTPSVIVMSYGLIPFSRILKNILREGRLP
ncbi:TPA: hypothetical protein ACUS1Q_005175, partial [Escherichia coli]